MTKPLRLPDRRAAHRPVNGDVAPCSRCAEGILEFNERYRIPLASNGKVAVVAAWSCDRCHYIRLARESEQPATLRAASRATRVKAKRQLMKSRAVRARAARVLSKAQRSVKRR